MPEPGRLRILYAGTPDFAVPPLRALVESGFPPQAVFTQPDRPAGRGRHLRPGPVKHAALEAGLPVHQPTSLSEPDVLAELTDLEPDLMIVVAYGLILPPAALEIPRHGCWNIHASLLPRWRGAAPIQRAIEAGDSLTGVSIMQMDAGLDTGPVIRRVEVPIAPDETGGSLHDRLAQAGAECLLACVRDLAEGKPISAEPQPERGASYAKKLDKAEARIDWAEPAVAIERRVRAFDPWPVAWCDIGGERTRIWRARALPNGHGKAPGTVLSTGRRGIDVATAQGVLRLLELQPPGKRRMMAADYLNARTVPGMLDSPGPDARE